MIPAAMLILLAGACMVVVGVAMLSPAVAMICGGALVMAGALGLAAAQERRTPVEVPK